MAKICLCLLLWGCSDGTPARVDATTAALLRLSLNFVSDDDGATSAAPVSLFFEPGGAANLLTLDPAGATARSGTYAYDGKSLTLHLSGLDAQVPLDVVQTTTVTLPFAVVSTAAASSTWSVQLAFLRNLEGVYTSAFLGGLSSEAAFDRAVAYANAQADSPADDPRSPLTPFVAKVTKPQPYVLTICFTVGGCEWVKVGGERLDGRPATYEVVTSPIQGDLLNELQVAPPGPTWQPTGTDPPNKTALFVLPFKDAYRTQYIDGAGDQRTALTETWDDEIAKTNGYHYADVEQVAAQNLYGVSELADQNVTLVELIHQLLPPPLGVTPIMPGVLVIETHGGSDGSLVLADTLTTLHPDLDDPREWEAAFSSFLDGIHQAFPDDQFPGIADELTATDPNQPLSYKMFLRAATFDGRDGLNSPGLPLHTIAIRPELWTWLRQHGADFSRSLVYIGGCDTDAKDALRNAIGARAYFAYAAPIPSSSIAILSYLLKSLGRHTHTAEEAYYNVLRVLRTKQAIYPEDSLLDGFQHPSCVPADPARDPCNVGTREYLAVNFHGHAAEGGGAPRNFLEGGWLTDPKPGNIWWVLFKSRWYTNTTMPTSLLECWTQWWSTGTTGPSTTAPSCYDMAPGEAPTSDEVGYASYLDHGDPVVPTKLSLVPRWTWNDGP